MDRYKYQQGYIRHVTEGNEDENSVTTPDIHATSAGNEDDSLHDNGNDAGDALPFKAVSYADLYNSAKQRRDDAAVRRSRTIEYIREQQGKGNDIRKALLDMYAPTRDIDKEARIKRIAKIQAWGNLISALGAGIVGGVTEGYVPRTGNDYPMLAVQQLNQLEQDYLRNERNYKELKLKLGMAGQQTQEKYAYEELKDADRVLGDNEKRLFELEKLALTDSLTKRQKTELALLQAKISHDNMRLKHDNDMTLEKARGRNSMAVAHIRNSGTGSGRTDKRYRFINTDNDTEVVLDEAETNYFYNLGVRFGIIPEDGSKTTLNTSKTRGRMNENSSREVLYSFDKQSREERTRMLKCAYEVNRLLEYGFSEADIQGKLELITKHGITADEIASTLDDAEKRGKWKRNK